ncbi:hypothetical protein EPIB2_736 [Tritonibacter mobilis]|nr:hypothetical protein EPIB2_736 [Tritonibacter mobilis]
MCVSLAVLFVPRFGFIFADSSRGIRTFRRFAVEWLGKYSAQQKD